MAANLQDITSVAHGMYGGAIGTTLANMLTAPTDYDVTYKVNSIIVSNIDGTNDVDVSVQWTGYYGGNAWIAKTVTVPADSTLVVLSKDNPIYLSAYCTIKAQASANSDAEILISYEIITSSSGTFGTL